MPPTETRTFGLHRVEVFVSFINSSTLALISVFIMYKSYARFLSPVEVESTGMLVVAVVGFVVNLVVALRLHGHAHDMNVRSAFLHVVSDAAASAGVIVAAIVIHFTGWYKIDTIVSVLIAVVIFFASFKIIRESSHILLEGVPREVDLATVTGDITAFEGVTGVHSLHIWSICHNINSMSAHIDILPEHKDKTTEIIGHINEMLAQKHHIFYTTLQADCPGECGGKEVLRTIEHKHHGHSH